MQILSKVQVDSSGRHMPDLELYQDHFEAQAEVDASPAAVFDLIADHSRLSAHMTEPSWMMAESRMSSDLDEKQGRAVGSKITLRGTVLGLPLKVEEIVTDYAPPYTKSWKTIGSPRLLVIGAYCMGFSLARRQGGSLLRVFINYSPRDEGVARLLGQVFGRSYAKWCVNRMVRDAVAHFHTHQGHL